MNNNKCQTCGGDISPERLEALMFLGKQERICISCVSQNDVKVKGIYPNFSGQSFFIADNIGAFDERPVWDKTPLEKAIENEELESDESNEENTV